MVQPRCNVPAASVFSAEKVQKSQELAEIQCTFSKAVYHTKYERRMTGFGNGIQLHNCEVKIELTDRLK